MRQSPLEWLGAGGHCVSMVEQHGHPPYSWDFARYAYMVRSGFAAEYIDEAQAWELLGLIITQISGALIGELTRTPTPGRQKP